MCYSALGLYMHSDRRPHGFFHRTARFCALQPRLTPKENNLVEYFYNSDRDAEGAGSFGPGLIRDVSVFRAIKLLS
jgi:hypothetical protein